MAKEGFLTRNIAGFAGAMESVIVNEVISRSRGLLQGLDPRAKLLSFLMLIVTVYLVRHILVLLVILALVYVLVVLSRISLVFFLKRSLIFVPFTAVVALPALFITPGGPLLQVGGHVIITVQGAGTAGLLICRVMDSVSFGILLILTTPWTRIMAALRWFRVPALIVDILGMTYRYIFLLLHTTNSMFLARRSRVIGTFSSRENRRWLISALTTMMVKTQHLSEEVFLAMTSRGYRGEMHILAGSRLRARDSLWLLATMTAAAVLVWSNAI